MNDTLAKSMVLDSIWLKYRIFFSQIDSFWLDLAKVSSHSCSIFYGME